MMPQHHPRRAAVTQAARDITAAILTAWGDYQLSDVELLFIVSEWQTNLLGRMRYSEWNPDEDEET